MGFPVGYSELLLPKLLLQFLFFLGFLRRIISSAFDAVGLGDLLDSDAPWPDPPTETTHRSTRYQPPEFQSVSAMLIQEILPVVLFKDLLTGEGGIDRRPMTDSCAVCLNEIERCEEVRRLSNCRHVFHRCCLDRWMQHDHRSCPLCRTPLIPEEMQETFNLRLWAAAGIPDSDSGDYPSPSSFPSPFSFPPSPFSFPPLSPALV